MFPTHLIRTPFSKVINNILIALCYHPSQFRYFKKGIQYQFSGPFSSFLLVAHLEIKGCFIKIYWWSPNAYYYLSIFDKMCNFGPFHPLNWHKRVKKKKESGPSHKTSIFPSKKYLFISINFFFFGLLIF